MPEVPYQARILIGAQAYNEPYGMPWGNAEVGLLVTIISEWKGHGKVDFPRWPKNGKPYWVELKYLEPFVPPEPPPPQEEPFVTHVIEVHPNGSITVDGNFIP